MAAPAAASSSSAVGKKRKLGNNDNGKDEKQPKQPNQSQRDQFCCVNPLSGKCSRYSSIRGSIKPNVKGVKCYDTERQCNEKCQIIPLDVQTQHLSPFLEDEEAARLRYWFNMRGVEGPRASYAMLKHLLPLDRYGRNLEALHRWIFPPPNGETTRALAWNDPGLTMVFSFLIGGLYFHAGAILRDGNGNYNIPRAEDNPGLRANYFKILEILRWLLKKPTERKNFGLWRLRSEIAQTVYFQSPPPFFHLMPVVFHYNDVYLMPREWYLSRPRLENFWQIERIDYERMDWKRNDIIDGNAMIDKVPRFDLCHSQFILYFLEGNYMRYGCPVLPILHTIAKRDPAIIPRFVRELGADFEQHWIPFSSAPPGQQVGDANVFTLLQRRLSNILKFIQTRSEHYDKGLSQFLETVKTNARNMLPGFNDAMLNIMKSADIIKMCEKQWSVVKTEEEALAMLISMSQIPNGAVRDVFVRSPKEFKIEVKAATQWYEVNAWKGFIYDVCAKFPSIVSNVTLLRYILYESSGVGLRGIFTIFMMEEIFQRVKQPIEWIRGLFVWIDNDVRHRSAYEALKLDAANIMNRNDWKELDNTTLLGWFPYTHSHASAIANC